MTARVSWSQWQIGESFDQQASGKSNGVTELRCMVTCPDCGEDINVTAASAKKNLSLTARQHQKRCASSPIAARVALPASKRPRTEAPRDPPPVVGELQEELTEKDLRLGAYAEGEARLITHNESLREELTAKGKEVTVLVTKNETLVSRNDTLAGRVHNLEEQVVGRDERVHNLEERVAEKDGLLANVQGQMEQMRADMDQMRLQIQQLQPLVPLVKRINKELGLAVSVPPAAPIDTYVGRLDGLKKAAGLASAVGNKTAVGLERVRQERDKYKDKSARDDRQIDGLLEKDARNERKIDGLAHALESERSKGHSALHPDVARQRRQLLKHVHPDNAPKYANCTPVQVLEQLTKKVTA